MKEEVNNIKAEGSGKGNPRSGKHLDTEKVSDLKLQIAETVAENEKLKKKIAFLSSQTKRLDEQVFDLFTIAQASRVFTANPDIYRLTGILLSMIVEKLRTEKAAFMLYNDDFQGYEVIKVVGLDEKLVKNIKYKAREGLFWQMIASGEPFSVIDIEGNLRFEQIFSEHKLDLLESSYWIPLKTRESVIGIVTLDRSDFTASEINFLSLLASQAAAAFESAHLYSKLGASTKELDKQMHQLTILYDVGKALNFIDDLTKLLSVILDQSIEIAEAEKGSLMLLDTRADELAVRVVRGIDKVTEERIISGDIQCTRIHRGEGIAGKVLATGKGIIINNVEDNADFKKSKDSRVVNILCVPLKVYEEVIGVINITNKKSGRPFTNEDMTIIMALASQAAVAINNARLYEMAVTDGLTKLYIRRHLLQRMEEELRRARRYKHPLSLLMIDIDHFKQFNDNFGHQAGDLVLIELAKLFKRIIRGTDMAGRYGGEEFCIVLPETDSEGAIAIGERLRKEIEEYELVYDRQPIKVTISIGIATFPSHSMEMKELIRKADMALYASKDAGRNAVTLSKDVDPNAPVYLKPERPDDLKTKLEDKLEEQSLPEVILEQNQDLPRGRTSIG
ncbi:MAG: sensor domain-containing diguanylate cyclase [Chloroflexi bacterium]|nr:sensor domain-containing diguanylate cyclase [Chloroflexota bacterium]